MEIKQNWNYTGLELYLRKDLIKPFSGLYVLVGLNGDTLESEAGCFMEKKFRVHYTLDPSAFPSYNYPSLTQEQALSETSALEKMSSDFDRLSQLWLSSGRDAMYESPSFMIDWALSKRYEPAWLDWAISKKLYNPSSEILDILHEIKIKKLTNNPNGKRTGLEKWQIPGTIEYTCRKIALEYIEAKKPISITVVALAKHVEQVLKDRDIRGARDDYLKWSTIKRESLAGITTKKTKNN